MINAIRMQNVGPADEMELSFAPRLNVITGDNGLGKSFILDVAWWALTRTWAGDTARPRLPRRDGKAPLKASIEFQVFGRAGLLSPTSVSYDPTRKTGNFWPLKRGRPPQTGLTIYARIDGGYSVWDPARNYLIDAPSRGFVDPDRPAAFHFQSQQLWDGLDFGGVPYCNGLIKDWESWQTRKRDVFERFTSVLSILSKGQGEPDPAEEMRPGPYVRLDIGDARELPSIALPYGDVPVTLLSAAMRRVLSLAYLLVWAWEEHRIAAERLNEKPSRSIVLLVDEIESHLHPKWQRIIIPAILEAVRALNAEVHIQLLAVTHSPMVLASLEPLFDERNDKLFKFDLEDGRVLVDEMNWYPLGSVDSWLTSDVFDLGEARSVQAESMIKHALKALENQNLPLDERRRIHHELHNLLGNDDPYWPRWVMFAGSKGIEP